MRSPLLNWLKMSEEKTYLNPTAKHNEAAIRAKIQAIDIFSTEINRLAKEFVPHFHWMNHQVSRKWHCDKSPIGMCVNKLYYNGLGENEPLHIGECIFCGDPDERK